MKLKTKNLKLLFISIPIVCQTYKFVYRYLFGSFRAVLCRQLKAFGRVKLLLAQLRIQALCEAHAHAAPPRLTAEPSHRCRCLELVRTACVEAAHRWRHQLRPLAEQRRDCGRHAAQALVPRFLQRRCLASHADTRPSISPHSPTIPGTASACREACMQAAMVAKTCWVALDALAH